MFLTTLTVRLASVGLRNVAEYIPTCDRCMENPFFNFLAERNWNATGQATDPCLPCQLL